jgi:hypothetical protein
MNNLTMEATLPHTETPTALSSSSISGSFKCEEDDGPTTPAAAAAAVSAAHDDPSKKLSGLFPLHDKTVPSPPKVNGNVVEMEIDEVKSRMWKLGIPPLLLSDYAFKKLAYIIGKGLDVQIEAEKAWYQSTLIIILALLNEWTPMGKHFAALFRSEGDTLWASPEDAKSLSFDAFLLENLPVWIDVNGCTYDIFRDPSHPNMEVFYRLQTSGNCYLQAPILMHWYLSLWRDLVMTPEAVGIIDLSKFVRNTFSPEYFHDYIVKDTGGDPRQIAKKLIPDNRLYLIEGTASFDRIVCMLKDWGPALVVMRELHFDFHDDNTFEYYGRPFGEKSGHAMVLVGVRQAFDPVSNKPLGVYYLFQNFWAAKPFVSVKQDYFIASSGELYFMQGGPIKPACGETYSQQTGSFRCAVTSSYLERAVQRPRLPSEYHS